MEVASHGTNSTDPNLFHHRVGGGLLPLLLHQSHPVSCRTQSQCQWLLNQFSEYIVTFSHFGSFPESGFLIKVGIFLLQKFRQTPNFLAVCGQISEFLGDLWPKVKLNGYQISAYLVHRELRNRGSKATFEGTKCQPKLQIQTLVLTFIRDLGNG